MVPAEMNGLLPHSGNFQPGDHVSLIKDPTRRGLIVDVVSTWRSVRWSGRGTSNHRPGELVPAMLTVTELAKARAPVEAAALLQQMLDEEIMLTADNGVRVANSFPRADGTPGRQLTALRDAGGEWRVRCEVCDIPNILAPGKLREPDADPRDIASQAKRHVGAWKSLLGHRPVREHWRRRQGCALLFCLPLLGCGSALETTLSALQHVAGAGAGAGAGACAGAGAGAGARTRRGIPSSGTLVSSRS